MIQNNAIDSWMHLGHEVDALLIGEEEGVAEAGKKTGHPIGQRSRPQ